ncbi:MAG: ATP-binding protein [Bacteroidales bacterium]
MTFHQIILVSFVSVTLLILIWGYLLKVYRLKKVKNRGPADQKGKQIEITLKGDVFELGQLSLVLEDLERYQVPFKTILELNIILEEVFTGIINRQKAGQHETRVFITLYVETGQISAHIRDFNERFDPTLIREIDLNAPIEEISFTGLGFHMVRKLADQLNYRWEKGQNILAVKKNYSPK